MRKRKIAKSRGSFMRQAKKIKRVNLMPGRGGFRL